MMLSKVPNFFNQGALLWVRWVWVVKAPSGIYSSRMKNDENSSKRPTRDFFSPSLSLSLSLSLFLPFHFYVHMKRRVSNCNPPKDFLGKKEEKKVLSLPHLPQVEIFFFSEIKINIFGAFRTKEKRDQTYLVLLQATSLVDASKM